MAKTSKKKKDTSSSGDAAANNNPVVTTALSREQRIELLVQKIPNLKEYLANSGPSLIDGLLAHHGIPDVHTSQ